MIIIALIIMVAGGIALGLKLRPHVSDHFTRIDAKIYADEMQKAISANGSQSSYNKQPEKTWICPSCGHENSDKLNYCLHCRSDRNSDASKVKCPHCGASNNSTNSICFACHKSLAEEPNKEALTSSAPAENEQLTLIKQLAELHTKGILTDEEFETKKAELLSKM